jgi:hypothetical protein
VEQQTITDIFKVFDDLYDELGHAVKAAREAIDANDAMRGDRIESIETMANGIWTLARVLRKETKS